MKRDKIASFQIELKKYVGENTGVRRIEGYASTSELDSTYDIVLPTAFSARLEKFMKNPVMLFNHDLDSPIGKVVEATVDEKGLRVVAEIATGVGKSDEVWALIEQGVLKAFSFWAKIIDADWNELPGDGYVRVIKDVELLEVSVVSVPANGSALFAAKAAHANFEVEPLGTAHTEKPEDVVKSVPVQEPVVAEPEIVPVVENVVKLVNEEPENVEPTPTPEQEPDVIKISKADNPRLHGLVEELISKGYESKTNLYVTIGDKISEIVGDIKSIAAGMKQR